MNHRLIALALSFLASAAPALAQPNRLDVLERVKNNYPEVWHFAHRDYPQPPNSSAKWKAELYVRVAAWKINEQDLGTDHEGKWGVNGKRGDCNDLSQDVIVYKLGDDLNKGWDVIGGAGGSNPTLGWGDGFPPSTNAQGCFVLGTPITQGEIDHVMAGGRPFAPKPFPYATVTLSDAAVAVLNAFTARHGEPSADEIALIASWASELGWDGGDRIQKKVVADLLKRVQRYSGDVANPFPAVTVDEALDRLNARWQARFGRDVHPIELDAIAAYALTQWDGQGNVPIWLLDEILAASDQYDGSLVVPAPGAIDSASEFSFAGGTATLGGKPFEWRGQTAFMLQYEWFDSQARFVAAVDAMVAAKVSVARVGITVGTGYLELAPRSGGTFGSGRTRPLHPGNTLEFWPRYRAMLGYLAQRGIAVEVVPFLTAGAYGDGSCGERPNFDTSVPQSMTPASRRAYIQEVARELQSFRAAAIEIANEYLFVGFCADGREIADLAILYKSLDPARQVTTSAYHPAFGDYRTMHMERDTAPRSWSWVAAQLKYPRPGVFTVNDEGINADAVGEYGNDPSPANYWANGVLMRLSPNLAYTFHFDRALKGLPPSASDGSLQAVNAWRDGYDAVPSVEGEYVAVRGGLGADAAVARLGASEGWLLLVGATAEPPTSIDGWIVVPVGSYGPHRLYRLAR